MSEFGIPEIELEGREEASIYTLEYTENASLSSIKKDFTDWRRKDPKSEGKWVCPKSKHIREIETRTIDAAHHTSSTSPGRCHICSRNLVLVFSQNEGHGKHGNIKGFSRRSRQNLLRKMAKMDRTKLDFEPLFVTLTDQSEYMDDPRMFKTYLDNFNKRLIYKFPECCAIWRIEFQKRGALHLHMIVFGVKYICRDWLAQTWTRIVDGDSRHLQAGTSIERSHGFKHTIGYCAKYVAKETDYTLDEDLKAKEIGRHWGIVNRRIFYGLLGDNKSIHLTREEFYQIKRFYISYMDSCRRKSSNRMRRSTKRWLYSNETLKISVFLADDSVRKMVDYLKEPSNRNMSTSGLMPKNVTNLQVVEEPSFDNYVEAVNQQRLILIDRLKKINPETSVNG